MDDAPANWWKVRLRVRLKHTKSVMRRVRLKI